MQARDVHENITEYLCAAQIAQENFAHPGGSDQEAKTDAQTFFHSDQRNKLQVLFS